MALDLLSLTALTLVHFNIEIIFYYVLLSSFYLIGKVFLFRDKLSIIDAVCGLYLLLAFLFGSAPILYSIIVLWFAYKFVSLFI